MKIIEILRKAMSDDDFFFQAPPEERDDESANSIGLPILELSTGDSPTKSASSTKILNENILTTTQRLVFARKKSKKVEESDTPESAGKFRNAAYIPAILKKLENLDLYENFGHSLPYWKAVSYLCSTDPGAVVFAQYGGISICAKFLQAFVARIVDIDLEVMNEILRCLALITAASTFVNVAVDGIARFLAVLIDLNDPLLELDHPAFKSALDVVLNLSGQRAWAGTLLRNEHLIKALLPIIDSANPANIVESGLKILTNLASPALENRNLILEHGGLERLFELGAALASNASQKLDEASTVRLQLVIECLTNLVKYNNDARKELTELKGMLLPNFIVSHYEKNIPVYQAAMNLIKALLAEAVISEDWQTKIKSWTGKTKSKNKSSALRKLLMDELKIKGGKASFEACFTPGMVEEASTNAEIALQPTAEVQEILERVAIPTIAGKFYSQNQMVILPDNDYWNEICHDMENLRQLKTRYVQELCCAALNSRQRLIIYFGLTEDGTVKGIRMDQIERDEFRLGIDWTLSKAFRPFLEPTMYTVEFVPVCVGGHQPTPIPDLFVVELQLRHISTTAYQLEKDGAAYFRIDGQIVKLNLHEAGEYFAHEIIQEKRENMERLRQHIQILKSILGEK